MNTITKLLLGKQIEYNTSTPGIHLSTVHMSCHIVVVVVVYFIITGYSFIPRGPDGQTRDVHVTVPGFRVPVC